MTAADRDILRRAVDVLRERSEAASAGPWAAAEDGLVWPSRLGDPVSGSEQFEDAQYIALMHPPVALAVAGWLYAVAVDEEWEPESAARIRERTAALIVARAVLREPESTT